jgi:L-aminopeptidase/D-esterase-like protein
MRYLEERGVGFRVGQAVVPIVPAAILFDLNLGDPKIHPNADAGYKACQAASGGRVEQGCVGAGAGATVGKLFGMKSAMKSGIGTASARVGSTGVIVGALAAVNAVGDVIDHRTGRIVAGARKLDGSGFLDAMAQLRSGQPGSLANGANTTIGVVATNIALDKTQATKVAQMAHDGLARSINPVHTPLDGDTIFAVSTGASSVKMNHGAIGAIAAEVLAQAVLEAVRSARGIGGLPAVRDL